MKLILKQLKWDMVKAEISTVYSGLGKPSEVWICRSGETRVAASLYKASYVSTILWVKNPDLNDPKLRAVILLKLQRRFKQIISGMERYISEA